MTTTHEDLLAQAERSLAAARAAAESDPLHPIYHITAPANWMNDPNGPVLYKGVYHLFYQLNPYGPDSANKAWGHVVSRDLVHWEHWPVALVPGPSAYDSEGVWSGCCVVHEGVPTILYTGVRPEVQCVARSADGLRTWAKEAANPVIGAPPRDDLTAFRDPFAWREGDEWRMLLGAGIAGQGGTALLYRSRDLVEWEYVHPLCIGFGQVWECPNFFPLGDKDVLVVSPYGPVQYSVGTYQEARFAPGEWHTLDLGGAADFYAPNSLLDAHGRRVMWGWIKGGGTAGRPWNGALSLPRVLTLTADDRVAVAPASELTRLRGAHSRVEDVHLRADGANPLAHLAGDTLEIAAELEVGNVDACGLGLRCGSNGEAAAQIVYERDGNQLRLNGTGGRLAPFLPDRPLQLRVFLDRSIVEVYANGRDCLTGRVYPNGNEGLGLSLFVTGGRARLKTMDVWDMGSIWEG
ncbi:MAG: glycoside hydrolase family 32 protein [Kiritimatiellae bacterium]|nr:glycoside hydrolase family 32 protein [Kiritimatiellia bacterium]